MTKVHEHEERWTRTVFRGEPEWSRQTGDYSSAHVRSVPVESDDGVRARFAAKDFALGDVLVVRRTVTVEPVSP